MYDCKSAEMLGPVQKDMAGRADWSLVILFSKTYVFEDKLTEYRSVWLVISFSVYSGRGARKRSSYALHPEHSYNTASVLKKTRYLWRQN